MVLDLTRYPDYLGIGDALRNYWRSDWRSQGMASLVRLRIDLATGRSTTRPFDTGTANEFPRIDPRRVAAPPPLRLHRQQSAAARSAACSSSSPASTSTAARTVSHDFGPTATRASRCSFRRARTARRTTAAS